MCWSSAVGRALYRMVLGSPVVGDVLVWGSDGAGGRWAFARICMAKKSCLLDERLRGMVPILVHGVEKRR